MKHPAKPIYLVTGGGGYAGNRLGLALYERGERVILADMRPPVEALPKDTRISFIQVDIRVRDDVMRALERVDCVFHMASYGMSGREMLNKKQIEDVNIRGTENILEACVKHGITRLVYTSTYNVVFGGQTIVNGDETLPYFPIEQQPDYYSRTKTIAEKKVLSFNGREALVHKGELSTCALRLAGVYGPGEQRHLPRIVKNLENGLVKFRYGDAVVDFLHVDNLVQAHILAAEALHTSKNCVAAGKAYFISDGKPIDNFIFFKPLFEGLGYSQPTLKLPFDVIYFLAFLIELVHFVVGKFYNFQPLLTRAECFKTGVTHWFNVDRARADLGYNPTIQNNLTEVVQWFIDRGHGRKNMKLKHKSYTFIQFLKDVILAVIFGMLVISFLPMVT